MRKGFLNLRSLATVLVSVTMVVGGALALSVAAPSAGASSVNKTLVTDEGTGGVAANFIFPFMTLSHFSAENADYFQYLMYRPLYLVGDHGTVTINRKLSVADPPKFTNFDKTVTITLKSYKWSDTESLSSQDVMFWLNMWHQKPTAYAEWFPGGLSLPTILKSVKITSPTQIVMTLTQSVNPRFFLNNNLSTITPMPLAWTVTSLTAAPGSAGCAAAPFTTTTAKGANASKCKAVYDFLMEQSGFNPTKPKTTINAFPTYATSKIWSVVDGPWKLTSFTATVNFTLIPNPKYSGPVKPSIKQYTDEFYTSTSAAFDAMATGTLDVGQLPATEVTTPAKRAGKPGSPPVPGPNNTRLAGTYTLTPAGLWSFTYISYNFKSNGDAGQAGPIMSQLYFRQAMQHLINQTLFVKAVFKNYGTPDYSPVPDVLKTPYLSKTAYKNPYPYSVPAAKSLLSSHGWKVKPGGTDTCQSPGTGAGHCGKGVKKGAKLTLTLGYSTTPTILKTMLTAMKSSWSDVGIHVNLDGASFDTIYGESTPCPKGCKWEISDWGGWLYTHPDPTGTELFVKNASSNSGLFETKTSTALIVKAVKGTTTAFYNYENWEEKHLPVAFENTGSRLYEIHKGLEGVAPMDPMETLTPATFHWT